MKLKIKNNNDALIYKMKTVKSGLKIKFNKVIKIGRGYCFRRNGQESHFCRGDT